MRRLFTNKNSAYAVTLIIISFVARSFALEADTQEFISYKLRPLSYAEKSGDPDLDIPQPVIDLFAHIARKGNFVVVVDPSLKPAMEKARQRAQIYRDIIFILAMRPKITIDELVKGLWEWENRPKRGAGPQEMPPLDPRFDNMAKTFLVHLINGGAVKKLKRGESEIVLKVNYTFEAMTHSPEAYIKYVIGHCADWSEFRQFRYDALISAVEGPISKAIVDHINRLARQSGHPLKPDQIIVTDMLFADYAILSFRLSDRSQRLSGTSALPGTHFPARRQGDQQHERYISLVIDTGGHITPRNLFQIATDQRQASEDTVYSWLGSRDLVTLASLTDADAEAENLMGSLLQKLSEAKLGRRTKPGLTRSDASRQNALAGVSKAAEKRDQANALIDDAVLEACSELVTTVGYATVPDIAWYIHTHKSLSLGEILQGEPVRWAEEGVEGVRGRKVETLIPDRAKLAIRTSLERLEASGQVWTLPDKRLPQNKKLRGSDKPQKAYSIPVPAATPTAAPTPSPQTDI